ncbi:RidA family protein [Nonomuraea sp. B19D2]|uniref:RidA family protein n=1 Tax=Nonomuraea sp. B19D2 TaxID=3159561 RepID=UPI0032DBCA86
MDNLGAILAVHGLGFDEVVKLTVYLQHLDHDFVGFDEVCRSYFNPYPVLTTVGSDLLGILVEIDFVAHKSA